MNILLVNCHTAYVYMLAGLGHNLLVLEQPGMPHTRWDIRNRPVPGNVKFLNNTDLLVQLLTGDNAKLIDRCIIQDTFIREPQLDLRDRILFDKLKCPKVALFHNSFYTHFRDMHPDQHGQCKAYLKELLKGIKCVFISEFKRDSFGIGGEVILPGIGEGEFGGWNGDMNIGLTCLNSAGHRDFMNGTQKTQMLMTGLKWTMLGEEPTPQGMRGQTAPNFEQYKMVLRNHRYYVALNNPQFEDGYNLSMLEFMMTGGMAVTLDHPTSPVVDGVNGFRGNDLNVLNKRLTELTYEEAMRMGANARQTIIDKFPMDTFIDRWNEVLEMP